MFAMPDRVIVIKQGGLYPIHFAVHYIGDAFAVTLAKESELVQVRNPVHGRSLTKLPTKYIRQACKLSRAFLFALATLDHGDDQGPDDQGQEAKDQQGQ